MPSVSPTTSSGRTGQLAGRHLVRPPWDQKSGADPESPNWRARRGSGRANNSGAQARVDQLKRTAARYDAHAKPAVVRERGRERDFVPGGAAWIAA
jgi:hypothetical protein